MNCGTRYIVEDDRPHQAQRALTEFFSATSSHLASPDGRD